MRTTFTQSMAWLHTWAGLIVSWVLFAIFLGGTLACFDKELDYWMRPTLHAAAPGHASMDTALASLRHMAPHAETLYLRPPAARDPSIHAFAFEPGQPYIDAALDPVTGQPLPDTIGGTFFFELHYDLLSGTVGSYLVGLAGMLMLVALISGVIIHRRVFKDFFVFRPQAGGQRAWLDGHNLTGVLGLPFHLMIAYTGVAIMMSSYIFAGVQIGYRGDILKYYEAIAGMPHPVEQHRPPARVASLDTILQDAVRRLGGPVEYLEMDNVHDASITTSALAAGDDQVAGGARNLIYDGSSGAYRGEATTPPAAYRVYQFLSGLHRAQFGGAGVRWLYFLLGIAGCVMLASGLRVWVEKRAKAAAAGLRSGYGLVRALNIGVVAGMPLASVGLLWINRALPAGLAERAAWESRGFFLVWALAAAWSWLRLRHGKPWRELFAATAVLLLLLPLMNILATPASSLLHTLVDGDWALASIDLTAFALGLAFVWLASMSGRPMPVRERDGRPMAPRTEHRPMTRELEV